MRRTVSTFLFVLLASGGALPAAPARAPRLAIAQAAEAQVGVTRIYDPAYVRLAYPGGDVARERGVCADVVIRAFRSIGVDLQVAVHEDMARHFAAYPQIWGLRRPDSHIDHRRVPNLMKFFARQGRALALAAPYESGDVVAWRLANGLLHIGVASSRLASDGKHPLMVHNIGQGAQLEDILHRFEILGHYRW